MRADRRCLLQRLAFNESRYFSWDNFPANTMAYDGLSYRYHVYDGTLTGYKYQLNFLAFGFEILHCNAIE
jgi:hypothetical protein